MKILHSADWHLGAKNLKLSNSAQGIVKDEMLIQVQDLFKKAIKEDYDVVLICGDLFHSKTVSQKIIKNFLKEVENFSRPVLYIEGNHDNNVLLENPPSNFIILNKDNYKFEYLDAVFYSDVKEDLFDETKSNILLLHGNIESPSDNDYVNINSFLSRSFDYIALGHIHQFKKYKKGESIFAYSGALFSNGFDECGDKGYLEVVVEDKKIEKLSFVPFAKRRYFICECNISNLDDNYKIIAEIENLLKEKNASHQDLIRVVLKGSFSEDMIKSLEIIESHFEKYFYFEMLDQSSLKIDIDKVKSEKLSFKYEFISLVEESDLSEQDKLSICEIGLEALKGEGLNI